MLQISEAVKWVQCGLTVANVLKITANTSHVVNNHALSVAPLAPANRHFLAHAAAHYISASHFLTMPKISFLASLTLFWSYSLSLDIHAQ